MGQRRKGRRRVYAENAIDAVDEAAVLERDLYRHLFSSRRLHFAVPRVSDDITL